MVVDEKSELLSLSEAGRPSLLTECLQNTNLIKDVEYSVQVKFHPLAKWAGTKLEIHHVFVKHCAPGGNKVRKSNFATRSLTLMQFERASLVEYAYHYEVSISYGSKVIIANVEVDNRQTNRQTGKKNNMTPIIRSGA